MKYLVMIFCLAQYYACSFKHLAGGKSVYGNFLIEDCQSSRFARQRDTIFLKGLNKNDTIVTLFHLNAGSGLGWELDWKDTINLSLLDVQKNRVYKSENIEEIIYQYRFKIVGQPLYPIRFYLARLPSGTPYRQCILLFQ